MEDSVLNCDHRPQATYQNVSLSITQMTKLPLYTEMEINIMVGNLSVTLCQTRSMSAALHCIRFDLYLYLSTGKHIF